MCGICGNPVDFSIKYPHPLSACIDHIIPIAKGGHRVNADFHASVGLSPKLIRKAESKCCKWCRGLAGTYDYPVSREFYRRHENCRCTVLYDPADGSKKLQDVYTKKWITEEEYDKIKKKKQITSKNGTRKFSSQSLLKAHFTKHSQEFGTISIPEYLRLANALADEPLSDDVVQLLRSDGSTSKYRFSTNHFLVLNEDGTIRTFFRPVDKERYWQDEIERNQENSLPMLW